MVNLNGITLPAALSWTDEFEPYGVAQNTRRALDGSLVIYTAALTKGRPISLESPSDAGWVRRSVVEQLAALSNSPGAVFRLEIRNDAFDVVFRHGDGVAFEATPLFPEANPGPDSYYTVHLRLLTI
jgi:hypothetical protein